MSQLQFTVSATDSSRQVILEIFINDVLARCVRASDPACTVSIDLNDDQPKSRVELRMSGKTKHHTRLGQDGTIQQDLLFVFSDWQIDGLDVGQVISGSARYQHDTNGHSQPRSEKFFHAMGCNGSVDFTIEHPVYLWLLENM